MMFFRVYALVLAAQAEFGAAEADVENRIIRAEDGARLIESHDNSRFAGAPAKRTSQGDFGSLYAEGRRELAKPYIEDDGHGAYGDCGTLDYVVMCNGTKKQMDPICVIVDGQEVCFRGMCVCTTQSGCTEPVCSPCTGRLDEVKCSDGRNCMTSPGQGWSCWHPCNFQHLPQEFGSGNARDVDFLRREGACSPWDPMLSPTEPPEPPITAGLQLTYLWFPGCRPVMVEDGDASGSDSGSMRSSSAGKLIFVFSAFVTVLQAILDIA